MTVRGPRRREGTRAAEVVCFASDWRHGSTALLTGWSHVVCKRRFFCSAIYSTPRGVEVPPRLTHAASLHDSMP